MVTQSEFRGIVPLPNIEELIQKELAKLLGNSDTGLPFVDSKRIDEIASIQSNDYDFSKLVALCNELNIAYISARYFSVVMLGRAILDHVPPLFSVRPFKEVVNNYGGTKSFKASIDHLDNSLRKIADAHLHTPIRKSESLPSQVQVNYSQDLDVLLAEIIRVHKN